MTDKHESEHDLASMRQELASVREELRRLQNSSSYRLSRLLAECLRSPRQLMGLPVALWRLWRDARSRRRPPSPRSALYRQLADECLQLLDQARMNQAPLVFMFSGTTFIQGTRGNRPIRQTQALLRQGARVLFSYHRSRMDEALPEYRQPGLLQLPQDISWQMLAEIACAELGAVPRLFIVSYPYPGIEDRLEVFRQQGWRVIYDCRDDWEEFAKVGMARWFRHGVERQLVGQCDATLCVSAPLVAKMQRLAPGRPVLLAPNAVEADFLPQNYRRTPSEPARVGYFGHLSDAWFDWPAFIDIARACPHLVFEVIGHSAPQGLRLPANIELQGPKPWQELYRYAARWSAAIIPFRMGVLADGVDPIKIYEYLSFELPVVSFRMPQIEHYPYTRTVGSVAEFCDALLEACHTQVDKTVINHFIADNTWEVRAQQLLALARADH